MKKFLIADLAKIIGAHPETDTLVALRLTKHASFFTGVSVDSRTIKAGDCFFAIAGDNFDGHDYVAQAFSKGAACAVVSKIIADSKKLNAGKILKVDDTIKALGAFAGQYRRRCDFKVAAITGSLGKTTTRQITCHVLSQHYRVFGAPKNFNNNIGLPLTLLAAEPEDEIVIVELGSSNPGEIAYLTRIALPDIAVVTNVYPAHLAGFGNLQTIIQEKLSISEGLRDEGVLIINADFEQLVNRCRDEGIAVTTFGRADASDIQAENIICKAAGSEFSINGTKIVLPLHGRGNVENTLAAWSVCSRFGLTINDFARAVKSLAAVPMRAELLQIGSLTVLNDCYNANPASMRNALDILAGLGSARKGRLVFICGDMAELGRQSRQLHDELGDSVLQAKVQLLLTVGKFAKITAETAKKNAEYDLQVKCFEDTISVCNNLEEFIRNSDIILVKGSRAAKLEMVVEELKKLYSCIVNRDTEYQARDTK